MRTIVLSAFCILISFSAFAACPGAAVVVLPPQQVAGFSWSTAIQPLGDPCVTHIVVEPANQLNWYVGGANGVYVTHDGGVNWTKKLNGNVGALVFEPKFQHIYAGVGTTLHMSRDHGNNWVPLHTFAQPIRSLLALGAQTTLYIGLGWSNHVNPSGIWTSNLGAGGLVFHPFGNPPQSQTGLIVWTISRDPVSGTLYAGTEIFDHQPAPYKPPFFRSTNNAMTWQNVANNLPWHVIASAVRPAGGYVYALTEDAGLWGSSTMGNSWIAPNPATPSLGISLLMDPNVPTRLYAGRQNFQTQTGGIWRSINSGNTFSLVGLKGVKVSSIALNGNATKIYVAAYASGVYTSPVP
jgi:hypothetical protein